MNLDGIKIIIVLVFFLINSSLTLSAPSRNSRITCPQNLKGAKIWGGTDLSLPGSTKQSITHSNKKFEFHKMTLNQEKRKMYCSYGVSFKMHPLSSATTCPPACSKMSLVILKKYFPQGKNCTQASSNSIICR